MCCAKGMRAYRRETPERDERAFVLAEHTVRASGYASNLVMCEPDEPAAGGPIGARLAAWRLRRGLTRDDLASRTGLELDYIAGLETGGEWVDRRGRLAALAAALRLHVADLAGQPYPPRGEEHAAVRAIAFHLRRRIARPHLDTAAGLPLDELAERTRVAAQAGAAGDEHTLALACW
ncbi:helix-turn-helix domain-containing protein [Streptomyces sp. NPDC058000]|uniref:helix-turn-helix domain-containing protein n=1 Tax=Streptomyces sp. NPDC058000 TaxID=3346299 RepID=UPI0036F0181C